MGSTRSAQRGKHSRWREEINYSDGLTGDEHWARCEAFE
jgi:hypothetical protein